MKELVYLDDARRCILRADPSIAWCLEGIHRPDAKEVIHGHWIAPQYPQMMSTCSVCGSVGWAHSHKYCSQCGATMDGGIEYGN